MIRRETSANRVNSVLNHPSVKPWICGPIQGPIDFAPLMRSGRVIVLFGEHGGYIFCALSEEVYDAHSAILPSGRGQWALSAAKAALAEMFSGNAREIMMAAPKGNLPVLALIRALKAKFRGTIKDGWWLDGQPVDSRIYSLTKTDWQKCQQ